MQSLRLYNYVILRYMPDAVTGESMNVGLVFYCGETGYLVAKMKHAVARITNAFPSANGRSLRSLLAWIESSINRTARSVIKGYGGLFDSVPRDAREFAALSYPIDDSALRWSNLRSGFTDNPVAEADRLFKRLVTCYDKDTGRYTRTDSDIWGQFFKALEEHDLAGHLREHVVPGEIEPYTFEHAMKNGVWHCLEPISFDLLKPESIKSKARDKFAEMTLIEPSLGNTVLYFLIGESQSDDGRRASDTALRILEKAPVKKEFVFERDASGWAAKLASYFN